MPPAATLRPESLVTATREYEAWVAGQVPIVRGDIAYKHEQMGAAPLPFLRATFYRWIQLWPSVCPELARAPKVLSVGDLHIENFGTWRDSEGRLVWGVSDFDEAFPLAYTNDLVRLAASARLSIDAGILRLTARVACAAIVDGYRGGLEHGGRPFVLAEEHPVLRGEAESVLRDPARFWKGITALRPARRPPPTAVRLLRAALPRGSGPSRMLARRAGLGSLGHPRVVAVVDWEGARVAREAKAAVGSAAAWAAGVHGEPPIHYPVIVRRAVRCPDPFLEVREGWVLRRLAPDCSRIEFTAARGAAAQLELLRAMGAETANIHLGAGHRRISAIRADLAGRPESWLRMASKAMERVTLADQTAWRRARAGPRKRQ